MLCSRSQTWSDSSVLMRNTSLVAAMNIWQNSSTVCLVVSSLICRFVRDVHSCSCSYNPFDLVSLALMAIYPVLPQILVSDFTSVSQKNSTRLAKQPSWLDCLPQQQTSLNVFCEVSAQAIFVIHLKLLAHHRSSIRSSTRACPVKDKCRSVSFIFSCSKHVFFFFSCMGKLYAYLLLV